MDESELPSFPSLLDLTPRPLYIVPEHAKILAKTTHQTHHSFNSKLTLSPQLRTPIIKRINTQRTPHRQPTQQRASPINTQVAEHRSRKKYTSSRKRTPSKIIGCEERCGELWVCEGQVEEEGLDDDIAADIREEETDEGGEPVD